MKTPKIKYLFLLIIVLAGWKTDETKVSVLNKSALQDLINNRNGKILLLNLWATWCVPCREEIPDLEKLSKTHKNIDVVGLSVDYPDEIESKILPFLKENNVTYKIYVSGFKNDTELINFLNKDWNGALPATIIFDPNPESKRILL